MTCNIVDNSRRKLFWATQPDACGTDIICGYECGKPGLSTQPDVLYDCAQVCTCCTPPVYNPACPNANATRRSQIITTDWMRGLIINMLMTDGREADSPCGYRPGSQGGHWSESYMATDDSIGTLIRKLPTNGTVNESVALVQAYAKATLDRLITRGVALSVSVKARYVGNLKIALDVIVIGRDDAIETKVGISSARLSNGWVWS
jgi:phage gp46-like protein